MFHLYYLVIFTTILSDSISVPILYMGQPKASGLPKSTYGICGKVKFKPGFSLLAGQTFSHDATEVLTNNKNWVHTDYSQIIIQQEILFTKTHTFQLVPRRRNSWWIWITPKFWATPTFVAKCSRNQNRKKPKYNLLTSIQKYRGVIRTEPKEGRVTSTSFFRENLEVTL